eukprot:gb/GEZN01028052.1/.p1 GENE.gb/GEZN01028052.1/~~gb/GEZN01028052.1/.p1  ORF type:complete len:152 (-),score=17.66 gb/GEZN01028052.1/:36-446(-)
MCSNSRRSLGSPQVDLIHLRGTEASSTIATHKQIEEGSAIATLIQETQASLIRTEGLIIQLEQKEKFSPELKEVLRGSAASQARLILLLNSVLDVKAAAEKVTASMNNNSGKSSSNTNSGLDTHLLDSMNNYPSTH